MSANIILRGDIVKSRAAIISALLVALVTAFSGCSNGNETTSDNSQSASKYTSSTTSQKAQSTADESESGLISHEIPKGEPTVFTGLDGEPIYTSEITEIDGTDKTAAELTRTDYGTSVLCEGFQYFTEPSGNAYDNYQNGESFDDVLYKGEIPENKNECKRINVGEEICGLKLVNAVSEFKIDDYADTPEPYYFDGYLFGATEKRPLAVFDGSVTIEGFLGATARNDYEPDGGLLFFNPTESKLPILGDQPEFFERSNFVGSSFVTFSDMAEIQCGNIRDLSCSSAGLDIGDVAYVRVTLTSIEYISSQFLNAEIENIEMLSDILYHDEDSI